MAILERMMQQNKEFREARWQVSLRGPSGRGIDPESGPLCWHAARQVRPPEPILRRNVFRLLTKLRGFRGASESGGRGGSARNHFLHFVERKSTSLNFS